VANAKSLQAEDEDRVGPSLRAGTRVVLGRDRDNLAESRLEPARGRADHVWRAAECLHAVVVEMLVGDQRKIGRYAGDLGIVELDAARGHGFADRAKRVDEDRPLAGRQAERRLSEPLDPHRFLPRTKLTCT
jgi:hypothetical protein